MSMPQGLWYTDNSAIYCTKHLGASAQMTGRDISGQPIEPVTESDRDYLTAERRKYNPFAPRVGCQVCEQHARLERETPGVTAGW